MGLKKQKAVVIDCKEIAKNIKEYTKSMMKDNQTYGLNIFAPNTPDNEAYIKGIKKDAAELGIDLCERSCEIWTQYIHDDPYIVMYPVQPDEEYDAFYDVDGRNSGSWFSSRTASAVMKILDHVTGCDDFVEKTILVIGRGAAGNAIFAKLRECTHATLIQCNSLSDVKKFSKKADVIVSAAGANTINKKMVKKGVIIIDVGTRVVNGKVVGDVDEDVREVASYVTPVPNGVGLVTRACLMRAVVQTTNMVVE